MRLIAKVSIAAIATEKGGSATLVGVSVVKFARAVGDPIRLFVVAVGAHQKFTVVAHQNQGIAFRVCQIKYVNISVFCAVAGETKVGGTRVIAAQRDAFAVHDVALA
jgi:hypothetical protein